MKLSSFLTERGWKIADLARRLDVQHETARLWVRGLRVPSGPHMQRLIELTEGQVQPNDFFEIPQSNEPQSSEAA